MRFTVRVAGPAVRVLSRLDAPTQARIRSKLHELQDDPLSAAHSEPLQGTHDVRRARVGGWRLLFRVDREAGTVDVEAIRPRGQAYGRRLRR
ncbi:MAG: type II toxin-antitoxin system RelE/ParE family toxin [Thermoanaerobaculaceae bacterium]